jgi:hypothetical protein
VQFAINEAQTGFSLSSHHSNIVRPDFRFHPIDFRVEKYVCVFCIISLMPGERVAGVRICFSYQAAESKYGSMNKHYNLLFL